MPSKKRVLKKHREFVAHHRRVLKLLEKMALGKAYKFSEEEWIYDHGTGGYSKRKVVHVGIIRSFNDTSVRIHCIVSDSRKPIDNVRKVPHPDYFSIRYEHISGFELVDMDDLFTELPLHAGGNAFPLMKKVLEEGSIA